MSLSRLCMLASFVVVAGIRAEAASPARSDLVGSAGDYLVKGTETLFEVARPHGLAFTEIMSANPGVDPWVPAADTRLVLPSRHVLPQGKRAGVIINLGDLRLYYFPDDGSAPVSFPIGIGRYNWTTPLGATEIVRMAKNPSWYVPKSIREEDPSLPPVVPPGPDNPLGGHAIYLGMPGYLIHGTNKPWGIGMRVTHGCIRMYPESVAWLFQAVQPGTPVTIVNQPIKAGWDGNDFFVEVHREPKYAREMGEGVDSPPELPAAQLYPLAAKVIQQAAGTEVARIDWSRVRSAVVRASGVPVHVSTDQREDFVELLGP
ncbi:MAG: L,D-transpeptidase family protein [Rhodospirillales bacterium]|nr:L,D-transpeptidase family protein [Rhodospirillales bacterium]